MGAGTGLGREAIHVSYKSPRGRSSRGAVTPFQTFINDGPLRFTMGAGTGLDRKVIHVPSQSVKATRFVVICCPQGLWDKCAPVYPAEDPKCVGGHLGEGLDPLSQSGTALWPEAGGFILV